MELEPPLRITTSTTAAKVINVNNIKINMKYILLCFIEIMLYRT